MTKTFVANTNSTDSAWTKNAVEKMSEGLESLEKETHTRSLDTRPLSAMADDITSRITSTNTITPETESLIADMARDARNIRAQSTLLRSFYFPGIYSRGDEVTSAHEKTFMWIFDMDSDVLSDDNESADESDHNRKATVKHVELKDGHINENRDETAIQSAPMTELLKPQKPAKQPEPWTKEALIQLHKEFEYDSYSSDEDFCFKSELVRLRMPDKEYNGVDSDEERASSFRSDHLFKSSSPRNTIASETWHSFQNLARNTGFVTWLRTGSGVYWITGLPGSGKSTLMKFVYSHAITRESLLCWKGETKKLVTASHYFWAAGLYKQRSQTGFLNSILHQLTAILPRIVESVCPDRFNVYMSTTGGTWSTGELWGMLSQALSEASNHSIKVVLFIDGLDECLDKDHDELLGRIKLLASLPHVKICVSSRDWAVFSRHLLSSSTVPVMKIYVHEYTYDDVYRYTKDKLDGGKQPSLFAPTPQERRTLVKHVVDRAEGVFLWVSLVCKELLRGYDNDDSWDMLSQRLNSLPTGLESYYRKMVDSIDPIYIDDFGMLVSAMLFGSERPQSNMGLADFGQGKKSWTIHDAVEIGPCLTRRQIKARVADLVEVIYYRRNFIHRTVRDFLRERPQMVQIRQIIQRNSFHPALYWFRQCVRGYFQKRSRYLEDQPPSIWDALNCLRIYERQAKATDEAFLDALEEIFSGKVIDGVKWTKGTMLSVAIEAGLDLYVASVLKRRSHDLPEHLFARRTTILPRAWDNLLTTAKHGQSNATTTPLAILLSAGCVRAHRRRYRIASFADAHPRVDEKMIQLLVPFGIPSMERVNCLPPIGLDNTWQYLLHIVRHGATFDDFWSTDRYSFNALRVIAKNGDICDHFFDKRSWLPVDRVDCYELRQQWLSVLDVIQHRRQQRHLRGWKVPFPALTHWHCYVKGWLAIAYVTLLAPRTEHSHREAEISTAKWVVRNREVYNDGNDFRAPQTLPLWWSMLPYQLDSFCKLSWPPVWLSILSLLFRSLAPFLSMSVPRLRGCGSSILTETLPVWFHNSLCEQTSRLLITYITLWVVSVGICIYRRRIEYLRWFYLEQKVQDDLGRRRSSRGTQYYTTQFEHANRVQMRRAKAREADIIKIAAEARVRKLVIPYFVSFLLLWSVFG